MDVKDVNITKKCIGMGIGNGDAPVKTNIYFGSRGGNMLNPNMVLGWKEVEHDLYEENGYVFGIELDLFNGHEIYYAKSTDKTGNTYYCDLSDDIYKAIKEFNEIVERNTWCR